MSKSEHFHQTKSWILQPGRGHIVQNFAKGIFSLDIAYVSNLNHNHNHSWHTTIAITEFDQDPSVIGFPPPIEERPGPEGAEGDEVDMAPATYVKSSSTSVAAAGPTEVAAAPVIKAGEPLIKSERGDHDTEGESHDEEQCKRFLSRVLLL